MFGILFTMFDCQNNENNLYHHVDLNIKCFTGIYWIHFILSIIFAIMLSIISLFSAFLFYETQISLQNNLSKINGHFDFWFVIFRIGLGLIEFLAKNNEIIWPIWSYELLGSILLYIEYGLHRRFFTHIAQIIFKIFILLQAFISLCFAYGYIFYNSDNWDGIVLLISLICITTITIGVERNKYWETYFDNKIIIYIPRDYIMKALTFIEVVLTNLNDIPISLPHMFYHYCILAML